MKIKSSSYPSSITVRSFYAKELNISRQVVALIQAGLIILIIFSCFVLVLCVTFFQFFRNKPQFVWLGGEDLYYFSVSNW